MDTKEEDQTQQALNEVEKCLEYFDRTSDVCIDFMA